MDYCILSMVVCGVCYRSGHDQFDQRLFWSSEGGTRLAMPKTELRAGYLVIEARFRGYSGSPGLRGPRASGLSTMGQTDGL